MVEKALTTDRAIKFIKDFFKDNQLIEATDDSVNLNVDLNESFDSFSGKIDEESSQGNRGIASDYQAILEIIEKEIPIYLNSGILNSCSEFWFKNESKFKYISIIAMHVLTPPATSCPSERVFSSASYQIWDRRNRLFSKQH